MRYFTILFLCAPLAALAVLCVACGPGSTTVSCEVGAADGGTTAAHVCTQYENEPDDAVNDFNSSCTTMGGVPAGGCSATGVLGSCTISSPMYVTTVIEMYYSFGSLSDAKTDAMDECLAQEGATWTDGP
jgi:hypothetical protein